MLMFFINFMSMNKHNTYINYNIIINSQVIYVLFCGKNINEAI